MHTPVADATSVMGFAFDYTKLRELRTYNEQRLLGVEPPGQRVCLFVYDIRRA